MRAWTLSLPLDRDCPSPLAVQIARGLVERIRTGALRAGAPVPSSRALARTLGVHRNTVLAAYAELQAEGWLTTIAARGTTVARDLPALPARDRQARPPRRSEEPGFDVPPAPDPSWVAPGPRDYQLLGGVPDPRLFTAPLLARAYRRALRRREHLGYGDRAGHPRLRAALAAMLGEARGLPVAADGVLVTRGAQMALALAARALLAPGDTIAVEALGYRPAWEAFRLAGLRLVPIALDARGLDVEALAERVRSERGRIRAVYLTPHHQYPTTVTLAPSRRLALLELARRERLLVLEDDYDNEFHFEGRPVLPLASADAAGVVVYVGTLSKVLAPGIRIGFVAGPRAAVEAVAAHRHFLDRQGDLALEAAVAELFEEGEAQRLVWRARRAYAERREAMAAALRAELSGALAFELPPGGIALWCRALGGIDATAWAARARAEGVVVQHGALFTLDGAPLPWLRLGFGRHEPRELQEAVRRLARALRPATPPRPPRPARAR
ncbi:MAG TPA: PLP-dependent aminotransferase family protein [Anaeromyxobacter sp.]|nr:PLP-dependent aminotransferase family protein [Anaeromyxobacter sp.]